jgi:hypothetical protein
MSRRPSYIACTIGLTFVDASLRLLGLKRSVAIARRLAAGRPERIEGVRPLLGETMRRVSTVAAFYPRRALCLEQSLLLYILLRRRGIPVELRLGVQPFPFVAHAWIEYQSRPVNESEDFVTTLAPFPSFGG